MRIGFDARWYGGSGVGNYVLELLQALVPLASDCEFVVYENDSNPVPDIAAANCRKVPVQAKRYSIAEQVELSWRCKRDAIDVFHAPFYVAPLLAPCPVVVTIHDVIPFVFHIYGRMKEPLVRAGYRCAVFKATRVLADSQRTADDIVHLLGLSRKKIMVAPLAASNRWFHPNGTDAELARLKTKYGIKQPYIMLNSARHWRTKNLAGALHCLKDCANRGATFHAVVAGSPEAIQFAMGEVDVKNLDVLCTGFVPTEDLAALYRHAHAYLLTSRYEGFGLPLLEAMACGCAVVTSNAGSLLEVAGDDVLVFDPDNSTGMGEALARLLGDAGFREAQKSVSLRRAAEFSWKDTASRTLAVYGDALQGSAGST